jgi:hypothetical protein
MSMGSFKAQGPSVDIIVLIFSIFCVKLATSEIKRFGVIAACPMGALEA